MRWFSDQGTISLMRAGLAHFRAGRPFDAHEEWERAWKALPRGSFERDLVQALIFACGVEVLEAKGRGEAADRLRARGAEILSRARP